MATEQSKDEACFIQTLSFCLCANIQGKKEGSFHLFLLVFFSKKGEKIFKKLGYGTNISQGGIL